YRYIAGPGKLRLRLRPSLHFRQHEAPVSDPMSGPYRVQVLGDQYEVLSEPPIPPLRFHLYGPNPAFVLDGGKFHTVFYRIEQSRGYDCRGSVWSPGYLRTIFEPGQTFTVVASTESWET